MKTILTLAALAASLGATAQCALSSGSCRGGSNKSFELGAGYTALVPGGSLANHMGTIQGVGLRGTLLAPCNRLGVGFEMTTGAQPSTTQTQYFGLTSELTPNDVTYRSSVTTLSATLRYTVYKTRYAEAFAGVKGGLANFSSRVTIDDGMGMMADPYGCGPMPNQNVAALADNTWQAGANVGASIDMKAAIKALPANTFRLQVHAGAVRGGDATHIMAPAASEGHNHHTTVVGEGTPVTMPFMDYTTSSQHEHEVARQYTSPVRFFEAGVSLAVRF